MTSTINFRKIEPLIHLRDFVGDYLEQTVGPFVQDRSLTAKVTIEKQQPKSKQHRHPDFCCKIVLYHPALRGTIVAKKTASDFYASVREACRSVEKSLRRFAQTKSRRRHKGLKSNKEPEIELPFGSEL